MTRRLERDRSPRKRRHPSDLIQAAKDARSRTLTESAPHWKDSTPAECSYALLMDHYGSCTRQSPLQFIDLTRDEFIELKARLAELRKL